jgi:hypothetical protein
MRTLESIVGLVVGGLLLVWAVVVALALVSRDDDERQ